MTIAQWLQSDPQDYPKGLDLYKSLPNYNRHFLAAMSKKETPQNLMKLRYALRKHENTEIAEPEVKSTPDYQPEKRNFTPLHISQLPPELHLKYIKQKTDFATACSLKIQLNSLKPEERKEKALGIILELEQLFESINQAWKIFDHYEKYKEILVIKEVDFSKLSPLKPELYIRTS